MMNPNQDQRTSVSSTTMTRSALRPPGTLRKPPPPASSGTAQNTRLNNYMVQNRFRLLNPISSSNSDAITSTGTILRPLQRLHQQAEYLLTSHGTAPRVESGSSKSNSELSNDSPISSSTIATTVVPASTSRIPPPSGHSGLARPTPLQQIVKSTSEKPQQKVPPVGIVKNSLASMRNNQFGSSSQLKQASNNANHNLTMHRSPAQAMVGSQTRPSISVQQRPRTATTLVRPKGTIQTGIVSSTTSAGRSRGGSVSVRTSEFVASSKRPQTGSKPQVAHDGILATSEKQPAESGEFVSRLIDLSSVENDVGEIRKLLEQLVSVLQAAHMEQDIKDRENERLRQEVRELKSKIRSIRSTVAANADSEPPTPNIPQHLLHQQHSRRDTDRSPQVTNNEIFNNATNKQSHDETLAIGDRDSVTTVAGSNIEQPSNRQSVYFSPVG